MRLAASVICALICAPCSASPPPDVLVLADSLPRPDTAVGALLSALPPESSVRAIHASEVTPVASRPGTCLLVPADGWGEGTSDVTGAVLSNRGTVVALLGANDSEAAARVGIGTDPLPPALGWVWGRDPLGMPPAPADSARAVCPTWALAENARYDALVLAGRERHEPEAVCGFALRWHSGERAGSSLVVLAGPDARNPLLGAGAGPLLSLLDWLEQPYLVTAGPDYAVVRDGEGLRVMVDARCGPRDERPLRVDVIVRGPAGRTHARGDIASLERTPVGDGRALHALSGVARIPAKRWPTPRLEIETRLLGAEGRVLDARISTIAVWDDRSLLRKPPSRASGRRISVQGSIAPAFSAEVARPWGRVAGEAPEPWDTGAWYETFVALADAGARTVRFAAAPDEDGTRPEWALRMDEGRAALALSVGLSPEIVHDGIANREHASCEALSLLPSVLVSASLAEERELLAPDWGWPRVLPAPVSYPGASATGGLSDTVEADLMGGRELRRLALSNGPDARTAWQLTLLGAAGAVTSAPDAPPEPGLAERLLHANLLSHLLQPSVHVPEVALVTGEASRRDSMAAAALRRFACDWRAVLPGHVRDIGTGTKTVVVEDAEGLDDDSALWLLAWAREGGALLLCGEAPEPVGKAMTEVESTPWGQSSRVGTGRVSVSAVRHAEDMLTEVLTGAGTPRSDDLFRIRRNTLTSGGEAVGLCVTEALRTETVTVCGHEVTLAASPEHPATAAATETGVWFVGTNGSASVDGMAFLEAGPVPVEVASLAGTPLRDSVDFLLWCPTPGDGGITLRLSPGLAKQHSLELFVLRPSNGKLVRVRSRRCDRTGDSLRIRLEPADAGLPLVLTSPDRLEKATERVSGLIL